MRRSRNLFEVYQLYIQDIQAEYQHQPQRGQAILNEFRSALLRYFLSQFGYQRVTTGRKMNQIEVQSAIEFLKTLDVKVLLTGPETLQQAFKQLNAPNSSRNTYGSRFEKFLLWSESQDWWPGHVSRKALIQEQCCPPKKYPYGQITNLPLTNKKGKPLKYSLFPEDTPELLARQLNDFYQYLTEPEYLGRVISPIAKSTATNYLKQVRLFLGWFVHIRQPSVPAQELSFDDLFPKVTAEELQHLSQQELHTFWQPKKQELETWLFSYLKFMREVGQCKSPRTKSQKIVSLLELGKFQYMHLVETERDYGDNPLFKLLKNYLKPLTNESKEWTKKKRYVSDQLHKWPETKEGETALQVVQEQIVDVLGLECRPRDSRARFRNGFEIAKSHQLFLCWFLLAYLPARRSQEFYGVKIALSCPLHRPQSVPADGLYHPLPPSPIREQQLDGTVADNYLYKTYVHNQKHYPQGIWVMDVRNYKTSKTYGEQSIIIFNRQLADGTYLYDSLERYLYGWWMAGNFKNRQINSWWSVELRGQRGQWVSRGRAEFNPRDVCALPQKLNDVQWSWGYLFLAPKVGVPFNNSTFSNLFQLPAHRLINKRITPHTLRNIWATWAFQVRLNDSELRSLAYAMGHDVNVLRTMYERSTAQEKRRPIEAVIEQLGKQLPNSQPPQESGSKVEGLAVELKNLSSAERKQLLAMLSDDWLPFFPN